MRALMIGDSLLEYLREDGDDCDQDIFEDHFDRKGFNWGIAGMSTVFLSRKFEAECSYMGCIFCA